MTISSTNPFASYLGNGTSKVFSIPFEFIAASDLLVKQYLNYAGDPDTFTTLSLGTDYTVSGGASLTGIVTTTLAVPSGSTVTFELNLAYNQPTDYQKAGVFPAEAHESALDRLALQIKQIAYRLGTAKFGGGGGGASGVGSFNGRTGDIVPSQSDYSAFFSLLSHVHSWTQITSKPTTFAPSAHGHPWSEVTSKPDTFPPETHVHNWGEVVNKPSAFPPDTHTHTESQISNLDKYTKAETNTLVTQSIALLTIDALADVVAPQPANGEFLGYNSANNKWQPTPGGTVKEVNTGAGLTGGPITGTGTISLTSTGVVAGGFGTATHVPALTVDAQGRITAASNVAVTPAWTSITGRPSTFSPSSHTHAVGEITNLQTTLDGKSNVGHTHPVADVQGLQIALDGKAALAHAHTASSVSLTLNDLTDVNTSGVVNNSVLAYDLATLSWKPSSVAGGASSLATLSDVDLTTAPQTDGQALIWVAAANKWRPGSSGTGSVAGVASFNSRTGNVVPVKADYSSFFRDIAYVPSWTEVTSKPTTFTPSAHAHAISEITSLQTALDGKAGTSHTHAISAVTNLQTTLDGKSPLGHTHTVGEVADLQLALDGKAAASHAHGISDVTNLQTTLDGKAATSHTHTTAQITGLDTALAGKAATGHTHTTAQITGLDTALAGKAASTHTHAIADTTGLQAALDAKAGTSHTHAISDTTGLQTALDAKAPITSPNLLGTPTASSAAAYTATTQLATTKHVFDTVTTIPESAQSGTAYTLGLGDAGEMVTLNNASAIALTIPTNAIAAFPLNTRIDILQLGAGQVTVGGANVVIRSSGGKLKLSGQYSGATLWKKGTDEWVLIGDIA
jgi:hypothetical protein